MPLTDEQKAFLIFKEFTGFSDDSLFSSCETPCSKYICQQNLPLINWYRYNRMWSKQCNFICVKMLCQIESLHDIVKYEGKLLLLPPDPAFLSISFHLGTMS